VHSDLSDYEHSDVDDDEPHPEARRRMSMTEKAQLEDMMRDAEYHHETTSDVGLMHEWAFWIDKNVRKVRWKPAGMVLDSDIFFESS
jgi:hypothetical protein